ncbi:MAG: hypothetical protein OJJ21_12155 [Ferrovibrio sp.]|uniref:hypothetical protein n=1 Tax=Ferrovibrio sp. TaxID=1917215 RepID=UPI0026148064|nr:hypothetical protein [Ferrovibrio sp.]MCW0234343.1 hypothetical protein [Ferrovibrio sp.]
MADDSERQPPPGVGPHELRELELMLAGTKPAAMFGEAIQFRDIIPEDDFAPHVAAGRIIKREYYWDDPESGHSFIEIYYALPGEEWRIDALRELNLIAYNKLRPWAADDDREAGHLLGYTDAEVDAFLTWTGRLSG